MAPWTIVLSSAVGAIVVAGVLVIPEMANAPRSEIGVALFQHLPALAVGALGVYGLGTMLLTTVDLVAGLLRMRQQLTRAAMGVAPNPNEEFSDDRVITETSTSAFGMM